MAEKFADEPLLTKRFDDAMQLALDHHRVHLRKATLIPYVAHLMAVTSIVLELGGSEDEAIAALLHDAVEDGGGPMMQKRIAWEFGPEVASIVAANTDTDIEPKPAWKKRKEAYVDALPGKSAGARRVSLADKLHNARSIVADHARVGDELWRRFNAPKEDTAWYYDKLAAAFAKKDLGHAARPAVKELRELADKIAHAAGATL